jgi:hypothetical protein
LNNNTKQQNSTRKNSLKQKETTSLDSPTSSSNPILSTADDQNTDQLEGNNADLEENTNFMTSPSQTLRNNESHDSISKRTFEVVWIFCFSLVGLIRFNFNFN